MKTLDLQKTHFSSIYGTIKDKSYLTKDRLTFKERNRQFVGKGDENSSMRTSVSVKKTSPISVPMCDEISLGTSMKNKSASVNFGGFFNSKLLHKTFLYASDNGAVLGAAVAAVTSVILRPIAILSLPNVEKENKQYACTKSIASSLLGYGLLYSVTKPLAAGLKKIIANPEKYLNKETIKRLTDSGKNLLSSKKYMLATKTFTMGSDFAFAIPKAMLTVALIPPIMTLFFGKKSVTEQSKMLASAVQFKGNNKADEKACEIFKDFLGGKK